MTPCAECGMPCDPAEYHPFAACLMFKACHDSSVVRANLDAVSAAEREACALVADTASPHHIGCGMKIAAKIRQRSAVSTPAAQSKVGDGPLNRTGEIEKT